VLVPDPTNPQQFNRYSYVLNNALRFTDPTGHYCYDPSSGADLVGTCVNEDGSTYSLNSVPTPTQQPSPVFTGLPVASEVITWANGFGANSFAANRANPNSPSYDGTYRNSGGLHPGLDFFAIAGTSVYSNVHGIVQIPSPYPGDAGRPIIDGKPSNVVVLLDNGMFVIFGHVQGIAGLTHGMEVFPGQLIGTVADQGSNSHVHLALRQTTPQGERVYNPANYFVDSAVLANLPWSGYAKSENLYSISSFLYQPSNNVKNFWVDGPLAVGVIR
jgi:murein DD-endopeptidase MepM/ murein hydrolase activator NlpD